MMMTQKVMPPVLLLAVTLALTAVSASAQRRATTTTTRVTVTRDADEDDSYRPSRNRGAIDPHRFYRTPYRTRNSGSFNRDTHILSVGFGVPNTLSDDYSYYDDGHHGFGPIMVKYERAIRDEIGIGAVLEGAYAQSKYNVGGRNYRDNAFGVGVSFLGYYHFNKLIPVRHLDVYGGVGINISHTAYHDDYYDETHGDVDVMPAFVVGARYYLSSSFAPYFELGNTSYSWVNLGLSFRL